jgi:hypothetical protein
LYDDVYVAQDLYVEGAINGASGTMSPMLMLLYDASDIFINQFTESSGICDYTIMAALYPYMGELWLTETSNPSVGHPTKGGHVMFMGRFNPSFPGYNIPRFQTQEIITWTWARLVWSGCTLNNNERDLCCQIRMYDKWSGLLYVLSTLYIRTLGSSRGYTTNLSPWFNPSSIAGIMPVFAIRIHHQTHI